MGGEFIGPKQRHAIELAIESKNELLPVNDKGTKVIDFKEGYFTYTSSIPSIGSIFALADLQIGIIKLNRLVQKVPTLNPRDCPMGYKWDSMTAQTWMD